MGLDDLAFHVIATVPKVSWVG